MVVEGRLLMSITLSSVLSVDSSCIVEGDDEGCEETDR